LQRSRADARSTTFVLHNFRNIRAPKKRSEIVETPCFSASFFAKSPSPVQHGVFLSAAHDAHHYTGRNRLSEGIFLAAAEFATRKLRLWVRCIVALERPRNDGGRTSRLGFGRRLWLDQASRRSSEGTHGC
jgi:hypothetical protein